MGEDKLKITTPPPIISEPNEYKLEPHLSDPEEIINEFKKIAGEFTVAQVKEDPDD